MVRSGNSSMQVIASIAVGNRRVTSRLEKIMDDRDFYGERFLRIVGDVMKSVARAEGR